MVISPLLADMEIFFLLLSDSHALLCLMILLFFFLTVHFFFACAHLSDLLITAQALSLPPYCCVSCCLTSLSFHFFFWLPTPLLFASSPSLPHFSFFHLEKKTVLLVIYAFNQDSVRVFRVHLHDRLSAMKEKIITVFPLFSSSSSFFVYLQTAT